MDTNTPLEEFEEDLFRELELRVDKGQEPVRIDKYLVNRIERISRSKFQAAAEAGTLFVNGETVKSNYKVAPNDEIKVVIPLPLGHFGLIAEDIPLDIVYEDHHMMIINKKPGMVVHPGVSNFTGTLVNALLFRISGFHVGTDKLKPGIVHRLDKDTSGIMVVAKSDLAMAHLANQFHKKTNTRRYVALVWGDLKEDSGTIDKPMGRDPNDKKKMKAFGPYDGIGKASVTHYEVLERFGYTTLVGLKLETGRTHQIRVHMASIGHPVFNDERYGGNHIVKGTIFGKYKQFVENCFKLCPRQALHAKLLGIEHPMNKEWMEFDSVIPDDMQAVINKWRDYSKGRLNNNTFETEEED